MRALAFSVSGSETYATEPVLDRSASHSGLWQVFELICFRVGDQRQLESPGVGTTGSKCIILILTRKQINLRVLALRQMKVSGYENPPALFSWLLPDLKV